MLKCVFLCIYVSMYVQAVTTNFLPGDSNILFCIVVWKKKKQMGKVSFICAGATRWNKRLQEKMQNSKAFQKMVGQKLAFSNKARYSKYIKFVVVFIQSIFLIFLFLLENVCQWTLSIL